MSVTNDNCIESNESCQFFDGIRIIKENKFTELFFKKSNSNGNLVNHFPLKEQGNK